MKVTNRHGRLRLRLEQVEVALLQSLFGELTTLLRAEASGGDDEVTRRLFPAAYPEDERAEADYRSITEQALRSERLERVSACAAELSAGSDVELSDPDVGERWIRVLNDLRLALGTRLGVTEEEAPVDPTDPEQQPRVIYHWLTAVQDSVVVGLTD